MSYLKNITSKALLVIIALISLLFITKKAKAEDTVCTVVYGQGEICGVSTTEEKVTHETKGAGLVKSEFIKIAIALITIGISFKVISKLTRNIYLFEN